MNIKESSYRQNLLQNALTGSSEKAAEEAVVTTMSMTQSGGEEAAHVVDTCVDYPNDLPRAIETKGRGHR